MRPPLALAARNPALVSVIFTAQLQGNLFEFGAEVGDD
jgi:hypothetical protein